MEGHKRIATTYVASEIATPAGRNFGSAPVFERPEIESCEGKEDSFDLLTRVPEKRCKLPKGVVANFIHHSPYIPILQMRDLTSNPIAH